VHGGRFDGAAALLCDVLDQIGRPIAERRVVGKFGFADRQHPIADSSPVHITGRHPASLQEGGHQ